MSSGIKTGRLAVQLSIVAFVGLTFSAMMDSVKAATDVAQLSVIILYATLVAVAYKLNFLWQFCQRKRNFKIANLNSPQKGLSH